MINLWAEWVNTNGDKIVINTNEIEGYKVYEAGIWVFMKSGRKEWLEGLKESDIKVSLGIL